MSNQPRTRVLPEQWVQHVSALLLVAGVLGAVWGVLYAVNGMTQARATVKVAVELAPQAFTDDEVTEAVQVTGVESEGVWFSTTDDGLLLVAWDSTRLEQLLDRGDVLVQGLLTLGGVLALRPVLTSIAHGEPFRRGNSRRVGQVALAIALLPIADLPPVAAATMVVERVGLVGTLQPSGGLDATPLLVAAVVWAVAAAFRNGERMTRDLDGLV